MNLSLSPLSNINFMRKYKTPDTPQIRSLDYEKGDTFEISRKELSRLNNGMRTGTLSKEDKDKLILSRIPKAIERAKLFVSEHPKFELDDVIQGLLIVITETARTYNLQENTSFNTVSGRKEDAYFNKLLKEKEHEVETVRYESLKNMEDTNLYSDKFAEARREALEKAMSSLSYRQEAILKERHGYKSPDDKMETMEKIGKKYGVKKERIRMITNKGLRTLRHPLYSRAIKTYLYDVRRPEDRLDLLIDAQNEE